MPSMEQLGVFKAGCQNPVTGHETGEAQIFLARPFQAFAQPDGLVVGGSTECRIRKDTEDGGGPAFADCVWKPGLVVEMKKRLAAP